MKTVPAALLTLALCAGPAAAQGTFNPGGRQPARTTPSLADAYKPAPTYRPVPAYRTPGAPSLGSDAAFEPYDPYRGVSVYRTPQPGRMGAPPCETSVYINACPRRR
jgi:hypothetical protein